MAAFPTMGGYSGGSLADWLRQAGMLAGQQQVDPAYDPMTGLPVNGTSINDGVWSKAGLLPQIAAPAAPAAPTDRPPLAPFMANYGKTEGRTPTGLPDPEHFEPGPVTALPDQMPSAVDPVMALPDQMPSQMAGPTDISAKNGPGAMPAVLPGAIGAPPAQAPEAEGLFDRIAKGLGDRSSTLMALGSGLVGAPSVWQGLRAGGAAALPAMQMDQKRIQTATANRTTYDALIKAGAPKEQVNAALNNPILMKELADRYIGVQKAATTPHVQEFETEAGTIKKQWNGTTGAWEVIPGQKPTPPSAKDRRLTVNDTLKLSEEGGKVARVREFGSTFDDKFGGFISDTLGETANWAGRNMPGASEDRKAAADWWQSYDRYKQVIRNELYGASLQPSEQAAFKAADVTPGMQPDRIRKNLDTQQKIAEGAMRRSGRAMIAAGYPPDVVSKAYGMPASEFEDDAPTGTTGTMGVGSQRDMGGGVTIRRVK